MNIKIKGVEIEITEALQNYAEKRISEALEKFINSFNEKNIFVEVELSKTNNRQLSGEIYKSSVRVIGFKKKIFAESVKDDLYASIDGLKDKLEENISEMKDKKRTLSHKMALNFKRLFKREE
ncbi:MAG: ribosome-associated translation inhibitor RaiA [Candidatus Pacebacteria bacterium]|nr:ribosome-associated translation inhibitor RaiA [Candidatus Paceibacterota bacterium]